MQVIYQDANHRDLTVDRRETLLKILWHERYLTRAGPFRQGCSISNTARKVVAYRIIQQFPGIDPAEANRIALARIYTGNSR